MSTRPELKSIWHDDRFYLSHVAFKSDGKTIAAEYEGDRIVLWDVAARQRLGGDPLVVKLGPVPSVAISPDGRTLAAVYHSDDDGGVALWDLATGRPKPVGNGRLVVKQGQVSSIAFSPDGKTIAAGYEARGGGGVVLWDTATGKTIGENQIALHKGGVSSVAFSPHGKNIAAGYYMYRRGGGVVLWDLATGQRRGNDPPAHKEAVSSMAFSPDGQTLVTGYDNGDYGGGIVLWDVATGKPKPLEKPESLEDARLLVVKEGGVTSVVFGPDGNSLAASPARCQLRLPPLRSRPGARQPSPRWNSATRPMRPLGWTRRRPRSGTTFSSRKEIRPSAPSASTQWMTPMVPSAARGQLRSTSVVPFSLTCSRLVPV